MPTTLYTIRVHAGRSLAGQLAMSGAIAAVKVDIFDVEGVDVARNISEEGQRDVDEQVGAAAGHHEHADGRDCES